MKQAKHQKRTSTVLLQLSEVPKTSKFTETESRLEVTRDWAEGNFDECTIVVLDNLITPT